MLATLRKRFARDDEEGFTLIELMVVVLIIAILLAIAIPTFLGARERAQDRAAQSNLRNALTAEKVYYTDNQTYTEDSGSGLIKAIEPSLTFASAATVPATTGTVSINVEDNLTNTDTIVTLGAKSASGKCFYLKDVAVAASGGESAGTKYGVSTASPCPAAATGEATAAKW
jgi:type IV pilus assembly protein PilA